ncbi:MAG: hypothetical protein ABII27_00090 [bacterium]
MNDKDIIDTEYVVYRRKKGQSGSDALLNAIAIEVYDDISPKIRINIDKPISFRHFDKCWKVVNKLQNKYIGARKKTKQGEYKLFHYYYWSEYKKLAKLKYLFKDLIKNIKKLKKLGINKEKKLSIHKVIFCADYDSYFRFLGYQITDWNDSDLRQRIRKEIVLGLRKMKDNMLNQKAEQIALMMIDLNTTKQVDSFQQESLPEMYPCNPPF